MRASLFFGNYMRHELRRATFDDVSDRVVVHDFASGVGFVVGVRFGPDGMLYCVDVLRGTLIRITYAPPSDARAARFDMTAAGSTWTGSSPLAGTAALSVTFSAAPSSDLAGVRDEAAPLRYVWHIEPLQPASGPGFGLGSGPGSGARTLIASAQPFLTHVFTQPGAYSAHLLVVGRRSWIASPARQIVVYDTKPIVEIIAPAPGDTFRSTARVLLQGRAYDPDGTPLSPSRTKFAWTVEWVDRWQRRPIATGEGEMFSFVMPAPSPSHNPQRQEESAFAAITLTVKDEAGRTGVTRMPLFPQPRDGYIRSWWLLGSFPNRSLKDDMLMGGEASFVLPEDGAGGWGGWLIHSPSRKIDLRAYLQPNEHSVAYAFVWIESPSDRPALLGMNSDDGIAVWLNGQEVWRNPMARYVQADTHDPDVSAVTLKQVRNALLVKVDQRTGEWAFKIRLLDRNGGVMDDVYVRTSGRMPNLR